MSGAFDWDYLLTIPVGWRPPMRTYYADMLDGKPRDMHSVNHNGEVHVHPAANENAVRWALHLNCGVPREALDLPGVGAP